MSPEINNSKGKLIFLVMLLAASTAYLGYRHWVDHGLIKNSEGYKRTAKEYDLINPLLSQIDFYEQARALQVKIEQYVKDKEAVGVGEVGMYYRDLESGFGFGVNEHKEFVPASLLKLPTVIAYYKLAELNPQVLEQEILFSGESQTKTQLTAPKETMEPGEIYTVAELAKRALINSDNDANMLLIKHIDPKEYLKVFTELGIEFPTDSYDEAMTPKTYAGLFRILYNATYLNKEHSQKILQLLVEAEFVDGLKAGLNGSVPLANKFGERLIQTEISPVLHLHDCGIIYGHHPYVICVMTKGNNMELLKEIIQDISRLVYVDMKH